MKLSKRIIAVVLISIGLLRLMFRSDVIFETFDRGIDPSVIDYSILVIPLGLITVGIYLLVQARKSSKVK
jgi:hypothetical protein